MLVDERRMKIFEYLKERGSATTEELAAKFSVSGATIRRDLAYLSKRNLITRTHKGALIEKRSPETNFLINYNFMKQEKEIIAQKALGLIEEGDFIALSGGSTTYIFAKKLIGSRIRNLTIITNAINIATLFIESIKGFRVILAGGIPKRGFYECVGEMTHKIIKNFNIDKFFVGTNGISLEGGISFFDLEEAEVSRTMQKHSKKTYLMVDHTKFGLTQKVRALEFEDINLIITDKIPKEIGDIEREFKKKNIKII